MRTDPQLTPKQFSSITLRKKFFIVLLAFLLGFSGSLSAIPIAIGTGLVHNLKNKPGNKPGFHDVKTGGLSKKTPAVKTLKKPGLMDLPTLSYAGPQTYLAGTAITPLIPTGGGVAAPGYPSSNTVLGSGFAQPFGIAVDPKGNVFFADRGNNQVKEMPGGTGTPIVIGSGFSQPEGVAVDALGNVYVVDFGHFQIKEVPLVNGTYGTPVVLGAGFTFPQPEGIAVDTKGNVYVADFDLTTIEEITVGGGTVISLGSGFSGPAGVAVDPNGNVYVADYKNQAVKEIPAGNGAPVTLASGVFSQPFTVAVDGSGNVFVADHTEEAVKEIQVNGGATIGVGPGFIGPIGVAVDAYDNLYVTDFSANAVKKVQPSGGYYISPELPKGLSFNNTTGAISGTPVVGSPATTYTITAYNQSGSTSATVNITVNALTISYAGPQTYVDGTAITPLGPTGTGSSVAAPGYSSSATTLNSGFNNPTGVAADAAGNIYVADYRNSLVKKFTPGSNTPQIIGSGFTPYHVAVDAAGDVYVTDFGGNAVYKIPGGSGAPVTIGTGFSQPTGIAIDAAGDVYVADYGHNAVKKIPAGSNTPQIIGSGFSSPIGVAVDAQGNVYVGDFGNHLVKMIPAGSNTPQSIGGVFNAPAGVAADASGNVFVGDYGNSEVVVIPAGSNAQVIIGGTGFTNPNGMAVDGAGNVYVADYTNNSVKQIKPTGGYHIGPFLPAGLSFNNTTGIISGTPAAVTTPANYTITAYNSFGNNSATVNIVVGVLSFTAIPSKPYGTTDFSPGATSTHAITYTSSNTAVATIVSGNIHIIAVGSSTITATDGFTSLSQPLTVTQVPLTITANNQTRVYGAANPDLTISYTGLVNGDTPASLTTAPTVVTTATAASPVADYPITASGAADANYTISYAAGSLAITPAPVTITANNKSKVYGAAIPVLTISYTGLVNGDTPASLTTAPTVVTTATAASPVGAYPITASGAADVNYTFSYTAGSLAITPAPLTITAINKTKVYGAADPTLTISYSGFVNGDTPASLTTQPTIAVTATAASPAGAYTITASGAADVNYTITYIAGSLAVTSIPLTITVNNKTKVYGSANPALTVTYSGFVNGDSQASLTTQPSITTTVTPASSVGTYPILASGAVDANYSISYVAGSMAVTTATLTISANNKNKVYGAALPVLTVTYTGFVNGDTKTSLTTQPTISTAATASSAAGPYSISASGAADTNYIMNYVSGTLTVATAPLTITADNKTKSYGALNPGLTVSYAGFVNGDGPGSLTTQPTISTTATQGSAVGSYPITASGAADANYKIAYVAGALNVLPVGLTITAQNHVKNYGALNPALTVTYSGFIPGEGPGNFTTQPTITTPATPASPVGNYPITVSGAVDGNYNISYVGGSLSIVPVPLTIIANNKSKFVGTPNPALTVSYNGFVNGDGVSSLTTQPTITTTATQSSPVGNYPITASGAVDPNYNISYVAGTLNVFQPSANANLSTLAVSSGTITPAFASATVNYTGRVANSVSSITVTPTTGDATATIKVNGTPVSSGAASAPISLSVGSNTISTVVTAQDGVTTKTYKLAITRVPSNNANLASMGPGVTPLSPAFAPGTTSYTLSVSNATATMTVKPVTSDANATIKVNGTALASGTVSPPIALAEGTTTPVNVVVTAQDGTTTKTYTITVTRAPSADASLANLVLSTGTLSPVFAAGTIAYTASVPNSASTITITPTSTDAHATVTVNGTTTLSGTASGPIALSVGANKIITVVTAQNGTTTKTYTVTVTRVASANANLASVNPSVTPLSPTFAPSTTSYTLSVKNTVTSMTVKPVSSDVNATITVNGMAVTSGSVSQPITMAVGSNAISVIVTAQNGTTTKTYTLAVTRAAPGADSYDPGISVTKPVETPTLAEDVILVHQGISPNGDGVNDFLLIDGIQAYPDNKLTIMNRNGQLVYEAKGYDNSSKMFDGHSNKNGQMQLPGTYFYRLDYAVNGIYKHKTGFIVLKY